MAPLQGFTDFVYRNAYAECFPEGVDLFFTPFLRVEDGAVRRKDAFDVASTSPKVKQRLIPQIIANSREEVEVLAQFVINQGFGNCDINFGCPFPQQTAQHHGAGILAHPDAVSEVLEAAAAFKELKWSLKMRLGNSDKTEYLSIVEIINRAPLSFVTVHPRIGRQMYRGVVDMETFGDIVSRLRHPVVYNGDITDVDGVRSVASRFPFLNAVMIGRGILCDPFLPYGFKSGSSVFCRDVYLKFVSLLVDGYQRHYNGSEQMALDKMKSFLEYPLPFVNKRFVKSIQKSRCLSEFIALTAASLRVI